MDTRTGEILKLDEIKAKPPKEQKWFKEIPEKFMPVLQNMNRAQRRKFYREHKKEFVV